MVGATTGFSDRFSNSNPLHSFSLGFHGLCVGLLCVEEYLAFAVCSPKKGRGLSFSSLSDNALYGCFQK